MASNLERTKMASNLDRYLYDSNSDFDREFSEMRRVEQLWFKIHTASLADKGLQELLDCAKMYYTLLEQNDNR
jgi:hypothetical protein